MDSYITAIKLYKLRFTEIVLSVNDMHMMNFAYIKIHRTILQKKLIHFI